MEKESYHDWEHTNQKHQAWFLYGEPEPLFVYPSMTSIEDHGYQ